MTLYEKNLSESVRLRLSADDLAFLNDLASQRSVTVSEVIRSIVGEYRRSLKTLDILADALKLAKDKGEFVLGNSETDIHN